MANYKFTLQYDGANFSGWQIQENAVTVQSVLVEKINIILGEEVNLIGSGRTDAGVHALGQVANFRTNQSIKNLEKFRYSLDSILPNEISINSFEEVEENFHARFDAKSRSYLYLISEKRSPFFYRYSMYSKKKIDIERLNKASQILLGKKDFSSFAKSKSEVNNKICDIRFIRWKRFGGLVYFIIEADRFLHGMVRAILGSIFLASEEDDPQKKLNEIINAKDRKAAGPAVTAKGLFLYKVKY